MEEVREVALLQETFLGQVEEGASRFLEQRLMCQCHGKGKVGRKTDALAAMSVPC